MKMIIKIKRLLLFPLGLVKELAYLGINGSRDLENASRFKNSKIDRKSAIRDDVTIGKNCWIGTGCLILKSTIADYSYMGKSCKVQNAEIGSFCSIANEVTIGLGIHPKDFFSTSPIFYRSKNLIFDLGEERFTEEYKPIHIGHDVWIGTRALILDGVHIGNGAIVAANAVVTKDVPEYAIVAGIPAKVINYRFDAPKRVGLSKTQWWDWDIYKIKENIDRLNNI
jgi:chloramphenicol O-acetyltransferase type B